MQCVGCGNGDGSEFVVVLEAVLKVWGDGIGKMGFNGFVVKSSVCGWEEEHELG